MKPTLLTAKTWVAFLFAILLPAAAPALMPDHQCAFCHDLHGAAANPLLGESNAELVCDSCHAPGATGNNVSSLKATVHTGNHFPANRITCLGCHDPHDYQPKDSNPGRDPDQNLDLVLRTITVMPFPVTAIFTDITYTGDNSYDYADGTGDGICQVCHTLTTDPTPFANPRQRNDGSGSGHQMGTKCTGCHPHSTGFDR
jgi:predicted CXXCH cytochrome family protein